MSAETQVVKLNVTGMHCGGCANSVGAALRAVPGVQEASVSLTEASAQVVMDASVASPEDLIEAVARLNFSASLAGSEG